MIERKIVQQKIKGYLVENYVGQTLTRVGHSSTTLARNPLGEKITIAASRPGLVVGNKGSNIKKLTKVLKAKFKLDNPQIEIEEVKNTELDPKLVAENIASSLERFGTARFKGVGYKCMESTMRAGAMGIEILISGKIPSSRAKTWRFVDGYLKKCGDVSIENVLVAYDSAYLKTGVVGIQVRIMPPGLVLPDSVELKQASAPTISDETGKSADEKEAKTEAEAIKKEEADSENLTEIKKKAASKKAPKADALSSEAAGAPKKNSSSSAKKDVVEEKATEGEKSE